MGIMSKFLNMLRLPNDKNDLNFELEVDLDNDSVHQEENRPQNIAEPEPEPEPEPEKIISPMFHTSTDISVNMNVSDKENCGNSLDEITEAETYYSPRFLIDGLHLFFIPVAREIVSEKKISLIPLMREYGLSEADVKDIVLQMISAGILDSEKSVNMSPEEYERFIDIYNPNLFDCTHTVFDKEIFQCIGEIIFDDCVEAVYDSMPSEEILDYLNIMEKLSILLYDSDTNRYRILITKEEFYDKCSCIPQSFSSKNYQLGNRVFDKSIDDMSGKEFEEYCAFILSRNGFENIKTTPSSGDHGIDLLAEKDGISFAIQCKRYSGKVGNSAIQEAHTGKVLYKKDIAAVLTNSTFTEQALEEGAVLGVKLWDRRYLGQLISNATTTK